MVKAKAFISKKTEIMNRDDDLLCEVNVDSQTEGDRKLERDRSYHCIQE